MRPRILVSQLVPQPALDLLGQVGQVEVDPDPDRILSKAELMAALKRSDYLYCMLTNNIDAEVLDANPNLKIVANMAVGYNNIDVAAASARRLPVANTPGVLTETSADLAWALLMAVSRRIVEADRYIREHKFKAWGPMLMLGTDVYGKTLGIVGMGRIGEAVARRAKGFGMKIIYHNRHRVDPALETALGAQYSELDNLLRSADFVSVHTPYTPETKHLISEAHFALMKPGAFLINTARGPIVDEKALVRALRDKRIAGVGLDVYENEPFIEPELLELPNTVVLPHIASASLETRTKMAVTAAENVIAVIRGERPPNLVNPEIYS